MKLTSHGFTLVELLIIMAIIGILAAALFPSLMSYLGRGRDAQRISSLKEIGSAVMNYETDASVFPLWTSLGSGTIQNCINPLVLINQLPKFPYDPNKNSTLSCWIAGLYGYWTWRVNGTIVVAFSSIFENPIGWNTFTGLLMFQGNNIPSASLIYIDTLIKGSGSGYVIRN